MLLVSDFGMIIASELITTTTFCSVFVFLPHSVEARRGIKDIGTYRLTHEREKLVYYTKYE
jgi:hypothetical protein